MASVVESSVPFELSNLWKYVLSAMELNTRSPHRHSSQPFRPSLHPRKPYPQPLTSHSMPTTATPQASFKDTPADDKFCAPQDQFQCQTALLCMWSRNIQPDVNVITFSRHVNPRRMLLLTRGRCRSHNTVRGILRIACQTRRPVFSLKVQRPLELP